MGGIRVKLSDLQLKGPNKWGSCLYSIRRISVEIRVLIHEYIWTVTEKYYEFIMVEWRPLVRWLCEKINASLAIHLRQTNATVRDQQQIS